VLQLAYSGERAAGYAYRGHWRSVSDADERARIRQIEDEEWHHRRLVGEMLQKLGAAPSRARELRALAIGRTLGLLCHVAGWLLPMYGGGASSGATWASTRPPRGTRGCQATRTSWTAC
jgi:hypothetical protein